MVARRSAWNSSLVFGEGKRENHHMKQGSFKGYALLVFGWISAVLLFILIRFFGLESVPQFSAFDLSLIHRGELIFKGTLVGFVMGTAAFGLDRLLDRPSIRRRPYGFLIVVQSLANIGLVILAFVTLAVVEMLKGEIDGGWGSVVERLLSENFLVVLLYITMVSFAFGFFKTVDRKFGPGNLWKLIIGTYHHPREEELIFMFLDLKGSTTHAERLGHAKFSQLIQDCFIDLTVVLDHRAQVYQYVGDEVILYWTLKDGLTEANCLQAYFLFVDQLSARDDYYREKYGVSPEFKAGVNIGSATVLEVGEIKREISYLGDVLNTAARIQGQCNDYGEELLMSELLKDRINDLPANLDLAEIGEVELRGREEAVKIFAVRRLDEKSPA